MISTLIMGSPARRLTNPITRCWAHPHHRYAGTDDGRGTDHKLDAERLTLMSGRAWRQGEASGRSRYPAIAAMGKSVDELARLQL